MKTNIIMASVVLASLLACVLPASAEPILEIQFDLDRSPVGPATNVGINEIGHAYIVVRNADMMLGGAAFRLSPPNQLMILGSWFEEGLAIGNLFSGVELGFSQAIPQFGNDVAVIGGFDFMAPTLLIEEIFPMPHPNYDNIMLGHASGELVSAIGIPGTVFAIIEPQVGIFFDEAGTMLDGTVVGGPGETLTVYLMVRDLDHPVDSLTMSLDLPPSVTLLSASQPDGHGFSGDWQTGATLSFTPAIEAPGMEAQLLATLQLAPGSEYLSGAEMHIGGHQDYSFTPFVLVAGIGAYAVVDLTSTLSIPIGNEAKSWSDVKALYR